MTTSPSLAEHADEVWHGRAEGGVFGFTAAGRGVQDVAPGIGWRAGFGNVAAFRTGDGLVLFDTGNPGDAARLHADVRAWTAEPLTEAIYSHGHIDHVFGVDPFDAEADELGRPRPTVIAHEAVLDRFDRYVLTNGYNTVVNRRQFQQPDLTWPSRFRLPDRTYRDSLTLVRGELTFELFHAKGETDDATVAWIPERRTLCAGDLFIWVAPNAGNPQKVQRYPAEWARALRRMAALDAETLLPAHGVPIFGAARVRQALEETAEWLESLVEQTLALLNAGARLDEIVREVRPPAHLAGRPYLRPLYDEPEFVVRNIWRRYGGWYDGNPATLKPAPDAVLAGALAGLAGGPHRLADAASSAAAAGDLRLAGHLAELAVLAAPDDPALHAVRAAVFGARAEQERSVMARGVFRWAAAESRRLAAPPD
ncbi:alkyl sulfatase dimerization domain-containing protein [Nonomuraea sp. NPDC050328]|uniref:alkyl sulfatase dimerization domain-containing protein n=1 Tax=Nonomuraea sp. NPDC050328 TaxID=3364361 RepID=UPI0037B5DAAE